MTRRSKPTALVWFVISFGILIALPCSAFAADSPLGLWQRLVRLAQTTPLPSAGCPSDFVLENGTCRPQTPPACPQGQTRQGDRCVPACTGGQVWTGEFCSCPDNRVWNGASCEPASYDAQPPAARLTCPNNQIWTGHACTCPNGQVLDGSFCRLPLQCPFGQTYEGDRCVPACTGGRTWDGALCSCRGNQVWDGTSCQPPPSCPEGQYYSQLMCKPICPYGEWDANSQNAHGTGCRCPRGQHDTGHSCELPPSCPEGEYYSFHFKRCMACNEYDTHCPCADGHVWHGGLCQPPCPPGQAFSGRESSSCRPICPYGEWDANSQNAHSTGCRCPLGQRDTGHSCELQPPCPEGQTLGLNGNCVPACTGGRTWNGETCSCPVRLVWTGTLCRAATGLTLPPRCREGTRWTGESCTPVKRKQPTCGRGTRWDGEKCRPISRPQSRPQSTPDSSPGFQIGPGFRGGGRGPRGPGHSAPPPRRGGSPG